MKCPYCGAEDTKVIDSRPSDNNTIRRRRQCILCERRFTTYERVEVIPLVVVKKDGVREEFDRSKIEKGIIRACHKRPVSTDKISQLVDEIENELMSTGERDAFNRRLEGLIARYEEYDRDNTHWESFGATNPNDAVYRVPLSMLP